MSPLHLHTLTRHPVYLPPGPPQSYKAPRRGCFFRPTKLLGFILGARGLTASWPSTVTALVGPRAHIETERQHLHALLHDLVDYLDLVVHGAVLFLEVE